VLHHPVRRRLAYTLSILVNERSLVVERLRIVDQSLAIALDLGKVRVLSVVELVLKDSVLAQLPLVYQQATS
jgi:hypothetical protein